MKKRFICGIAALCVVLAGCAAPKTERQGAEVQVPASLAQAQTPVSRPDAPPEDSAPEDSAPESAAPEDGAFLGRWQAAEAPQCRMEISGGEDGYTLEITWAGASAMVWQASGTYDEVWEGVAYVGAKYEEAVREDGSVDRVPVPEREEVTGMVYLDEAGTLFWIDDFDHAGDELSFERA